MNRTVRIIAMMLGMLAVLHILSCRKQQQQPHEAFTFSGTVYECSTHVPLQNVRVRVVAKSLSNGGFFNSSYDAGTATTDADGHYSINPQKFAAITDFNIYFDKEGYIANGISIGVDTLGKTNYSFTSIMGKLTYLKLVLNNRHPYDANDKLYVQPFCGAACVNYTPTYAGSNFGADTSLGILIGAFGVVQNGVVVYRVNANDSCIVNYHYWKNNIMSDFFSMSFFCPAGDTTTQYLDY